MTSNQLSRRGAFIFGLLFIACGMMPILMSTGILRSTATPGTPLWVGFCAGLLFVFGGVAIVVDYGVADGVGPDGDFKPGTPFMIRVANYVLGLLIMGLPIAVFGWVAFGPGPRAFSSSLALPFISKRWVSSELSGRLAFGAGTLVMVFMFIACGVVGLRRLRRTDPIGSARL
jgi:hypothetical protein